MAVSLSQINKTLFSTKPSSLRRTLGQMVSFAILVSTIRSDFAIEPLYLVDLNQLGLATNTNATIGRTDGRW